MATVVAGATSMSGRAIGQVLPGGRLHLADGPIDLVIGCDGRAAARQAAFAAAIARFDGLLDALCAELPLLRRPVGKCARETPSPALPHKGGRSTQPHSTPIPSPLWGGDRGGDCRSHPTSDTALSLEGEGGGNCTAGRMIAAVAPFAARGEFITPMAAVAGAVAEEILAAMTAAATLARAYVNDGGDIALHLSHGRSYAVGLVDRPDRPSLFARATIGWRDPSRGIATSGWRGRSFSLGIADAVTVLAASAAAADAAATMIANAVDLPGHPAVTRVPASTLAPDSDLGDKLVTRAVGPLTAREKTIAIGRGLAYAEGLTRDGLIAAAAIHLAGLTRCAGLTPATETLMLEAHRA